MKILPILSCLVFFSAGLSHPHAAGYTSVQPAPAADSIATAVDSTNSREPGARFMLLPIIFSSPDTRLAAGVLPQVVFRIPHSDNPSSLRLDAYYTQNRQYHLLLRPVVWFNRDAWNLGGKFSLKNWPTTYYGVGNDTPADSSEKFTEKLFEASIGGNRRIVPGLFAGLRYALRYGRIDSESPLGTLASGTVTGSGITWTSTAGFGLRWDTRDNHFYPTGGSFHRLSFESAFKGLGSDYRFSTVTLDLRRYFPVHRNRSHVLATQAVLAGSTGDLPFRLMPSVGSVIRGYSTVRHIDRNLVAFQLEYRVVPVAWRIGFTAFAGVGEVFKRWNEINFSKMKYSAGIGLRYQFSRSEKINIRVDYGIGRDSSGDYIDLNEAF